MAGTKASKYYEDLINEITTAIDYGDSQRAASAAAGALGEMALGVEDMRLDVEEQKKFIQEAYQEAYNQFLDPYVKDRSLSLAMYMQGMNNIAALMNQYASQRVNIAYLLSAVPEPVKRVSPVTYGIRREAAQAIDEQLNRSNEYEQRMYATKLSQLVEQEKLKLQQRQLEQVAVFRYVDLLKDIQDKKVELEKDLASIRKEGFTSYLTALTALPDRQDKAISNITGIISSLANIAQNAGSNAIQLGRLQLDRSQLDIERSLKGAQAKYYESLATFNQERANQLQNQLQQSPEKDLDMLDVTISQLGEAMNSSFKELKEKPQYVFDEDNKYIKERGSEQKIEIKNLPDNWGGMSLQEKSDFLKSVANELKLTKAVPSFLIKIPGVGALNIDEIVNHPNSDLLIQNAQITQIPLQELQRALSARPELGILGLANLRKRELEDKIILIDENKNSLSPKELENYKRLPLYLESLSKMIENYKGQIKNYVGDTGAEMLFLEDKENDTARKNEIKSKLDEYIKGIKSRRKNNTDSGAGGWISYVNAWGY
ncbi:MAG: hypothetical protein ABIK73_06135 [candidate division WOR-3 bacterium]